MDHNAVLENPMCAAFNKFGFGKVINPLFRASDSAIIECMFADISEHQIEIFSSVNLSERESIYFLLESQKVDFRINKKVRDANHPGWWRYSLDVITPVKDLRDILVNSDGKKIKDFIDKEAQKLTSNTTDSQDAVAARFLLEPSLRFSVMLKTMGSRSPYELMVENISKSGLMISTLDVGIPFLVNTIVEMEVDPKCKLLKKSVSCLGKVTRVSAEEVDKGMTKKFFGIKLVQMNEKDHSSWDNLLSELELRLKN